MIIKRSDQRARKAMSQIVAGFTLFVFFCVGVPALSMAAEKRVPQTVSETMLSFAPLVKKVAPAVVNIYTAKTVKTSRRLSPLFNDPFFRRFFGDGRQFKVPGTRKRVQNSLGSGVMVANDGLVVTNYHVIEGAEKIKVVLSDRREFTAEIVGADESTDLAVLRIDTGGEKLPFLVFGDSDALEVGDIVLAIGNPFGVGQTVTSGIVSAVGRTGVGTSELGSFIQTDAAINPGNSGGALVTMDGRLSGINSSIFSKSGGSLGIGFAIPSIMVRAVVAGVTQGGGRVVRAWLGAAGQTVSADIASSIGLARPGGVMINTIRKKSPAARAGLRVGDVILGIEGRDVLNMKELRYRMATLAVGDEARLAVWRRGANKTVRLALKAPPEVPPRNVTALSGRHPLQGATVANMSPALAADLGLGDFEDGVYVLNIRPRSSASRFRFHPGDRILSINGEMVGSVRALAGLLDQAGGWLITIKRGGRELRLEVNG